MPKIFDETDPKAVPAAPTGRNVPAFPIGDALNADEAEFEGRAPSVPVATDMVAEDNQEEAPVAVEEAPEVEEKPIDVEAEPVAEVEPVVEPEPEGPVDDGEKEDGEKIEAPAAEDTGGFEEVGIEPGGGFQKADGPEAAASTVTRLLKALLNSNPKNRQSLSRETVTRYLTPLMQVANRGERTAVRDAVGVLQAEAIHGANFQDVVSLQHAIDLINEKWTSGTRTRKTPEERAYEKRIKDTREGATVLTATFELLKSIIPEGAEVLSEARKNSEDVIAEAGQYIKWVEGGKDPESEPDISPLAKRALSTFRSAVKGVKLEDHLRPTVSAVVNVKKQPHVVSTPDEPVREKNVKVHVESLFARLQPGQWVSVDQVVAQASAEYPDAGERPDATVVKSVIYDGGIEGVEGYTHEGVDGGWKPQS